MKIYKLVESGEINTIITYSTPSFSYLNINYKNGDAVTLKDSILSSINELLMTKLIGNKLALALYFDFADLIRGETLSFSIFPIITPYTCIDNSEELSLDCHEDEQISFDSQQSTDDEALQKALSVSIESAPVLIEVAEHLTIETTNEHFFDAGIAKSQEKTPLQAYSSFSTFSSEFRIINSHKIADFICKFSNDTQGIMLTMVSPEGDKDSLRISESNKKEILGCHHLTDLANILKNIENGEDIAAIINLYAESREVIGFEK